MRSLGLDQLEQETFWREHVDACQQHRGLQLSRLPGRSRLAKAIRYALDDSPR